MKLKKILVEQLVPESDFGKILALKKGTVDPTDVEFSSPYIYSFDKDYLYFDFGDSDDYIKYFLDEEDNEYNWGHYTNGGFFREEYLDGRESEEWDEGYPISALNAENKQKLEKIGKLLFPDKVDVFQKSPTYPEHYASQERVARAFDSHDFLKDKLLDAYVSAENYSHSVAANEAMQNVDNDISGTLGFENDGKKFEQYKIPISSMVLLYSRFGSPNEDIDDVVKRAAEKLSSFPYDSPWELLAESYDNEVFKREYQPEASDVLDQVLEEIKENSKNLEEYRKILNYIDKLGGFGNRTSINNGKNFIIFKDVDLEDNKIRIQLMGEDRWYGKGYKVTLDTLVNLLNNFSLFDLEV
jgi:hypothetical protein